MSSQNMVLFYQCEAASLRAPHPHPFRASAGSVGKESACNAVDPDLIPGSGRSPGEGSGNPLQYSCLENPMDRRAWWATVHGIARVRHDLWTKPTPSRIYRLKVRKRKPICNALEQAKCRKEKAFFFFF